MFERFSALMYQLAARDNFHIAAMTGEDLSVTTHWVAQKDEMATLVVLHVMDFTRVDFERLAAYDLRTRAGAEKMPYGQVANIFVLAGGTKPDFSGVEEYLGQQVYSVFWHVDLHTGEISVPRGQPKKLFGVRELVEKALADTHKAEIPATFAPPAQSRLMPKYRWPVFSLALIIANALILSFMYMSGYSEGNLTVPVAFGAIVSDMVIYDGDWWRLVSAMFVHFGWAHFSANAFGILIFGTRVERYFGRVAFCAVYLFSGLLGSLFTLAHQHLTQPYVVSAGASGAVYGIVGAIFIYTRITKRSIEGIGWYVMLLYIGLGFAMGFATPGIANFAHLGGLLGGIIVGWVYAKLAR